jgi:hypothetical protein
LKLELFDSSILSGEVGKFTSYDKKYSSEENNIHRHLLDSICKVVSPEKKELAKVLNVKCVETENFSATFSEKIYRNENLLFNRYLSEFSFIADPMDVCKNERRWKITWNTYYNKIESEICLVGGKPHFEINYIQDFGNNNYVSYICIREVDTDKLMVEYDTRRSEVVYFYHESPKSLEKNVDTFEVNTYCIRMKPEIWNRVLKYCPPDWEKIDFRKDNDNLKIFDPLVSLFCSLANSL